MDKPDADPMKDLNKASDSTLGGSSTIELGKVKQVLSVKMPSLMSSLLILLIGSFFSPFFLSVSDR